MPWHWLFFCPAPKVSTYFGRPVTKAFKSPKWHWLILPPIGANIYDKLADRERTFVIVILVIPGLLCRLLLCKVTFLLSTLSFFFLPLFLSSASLKDFLKVFILTLSE